MDSFDYTCPYCFRDCTVGDLDVKTLTSKIYISSYYGAFWGEFTIITCPNKSCRKQKISAYIGSWIQLVSATQAFGLAGQLR